MATSIYSGINVVSIDQYMETAMAAESTKLESLEDQKSTLDTKKAAYTDFSGNLKSLQDIVEGFSTSNTLNSLLSTETVSSDSTIVSATAESSANIGTISIYVSQLAQRDTIYSDRFKSEGTELNKLGSQEFEMQIGEDKTSRINVDLTGSLTNADALTLIAHEINNADAGTTASIVQDTKTTSRLVIMSDESGADSAVSFSAEGTERVVEESLLSTLGISEKNGERKKTSGQNGGYIFEDTSELNSMLTVNGLEIERQSNTIDDVYEGVTLHLHKTHDQNNAPENIEISQNQGHIKSEIESFIAKYNEIVLFIREKTSVDTTTYTRGTLYGDSSITALRTRLSTLIFSPIKDAGIEDPKILTDIGIKIDRNGKLSIHDSAKFQNEIEENLEGIVNLFSGEGSISATIEDILGSYTKTGGIIDSKQKSIEKRISSINSRQDNEEKRLQIREGQLRKEYAKLQQVLYQLENQMSMISSSQSILDSLFGDRMGNYI